MSENYVLVTGAAGFIGSRLTEKLLQSNRKVIALDCFLPDLYPSDIKLSRWKALDSIKSGELLKFKTDLRTDNLEFLLDFQIDSVVNQAAMPGLVKNWGDFAPYYDCNISALNRLLEVVRKMDLNSFIQASTSSVYGKSAVGDELQDLRPTSPYGVSKLAAEKLLFAYLDWYELPVKVLRYFSVYGPFQRPDMGFAKIIQAIKTGTRFTIFGDGEQRRSNTYIDDVISATILAEQKAQVGDVMNICGDETISLNQAIQFIEQASGRILDKHFSPVRLGDQTVTSGSNEFAKLRLGWNTTIGFQEGINEQVQVTTRCKPEVK